MNANIMKTLFFNKIKYGRSHIDIHFSTQLIKKKSMNANIMKTLSMTIKVTQDHFYVIERVRDLYTVLRSSDIITTLIYVLIDNFCPCYIM